MGGIDQPNQAPTSSPLLMFSSVTIVLAIAGLLFVLVVVGVDRACAMATVLVHFLASH